MTFDHFQHENILTFGACHGPEVIYLSVSCVSIGRISHIVKRILLQCLCIGIHYVEIYVWSMVLLGCRVPRWSVIGWDGCPIATWHWALPTPLSICAYNMPTKLLSRPVLLWHNHSPHQYKYTSAMHDAIITVSSWRKVGSGKEERGRERWRVRANGRWGRDMEEGGSGMKGWKKCKEAKVK